MIKTIEERIEYLERQNKFQDKANLDVVELMTEIVTKVLIHERRIQQLEEKN